MAPKKQADAAPVEGTLLPSLDVDKATGTLTTAQTSGIGEIRESFLALTRGHTEEELVTLAGTIDGNAAMKVHLKLCSSLRTKLTAAHKDAKAPFLEAGKKLDARLKECTALVLENETPIKAALDSYANREAEAARVAQATLEAKLAATEAELAKYKQVAEDAGITTPFIDRSVVVQVRGRESYQAAVALFGDAYAEVKTDENGVNYVLEVVLRRKEIQEV